MLSFNHFVHKHILQNKAWSVIESQQIFPSLCLRDVGVCLRDGPFTTDAGVLIVYPSNRTHLVTYFNQNCFDSYLCSLTAKYLSFL